jgi:hypothetical protein
LERERERERDGEGERERRRILFSVLCGSVIELQ